MAAVGTSYVKKIPSKASQRSQNNKSLTNHRHRSSYSDLTKLAQQNLKFANQKGNKSNMPSSGVQSNGYG